jgi:hypothetical protein
MAGAWCLVLTCCGKDDGMKFCITQEEADDFQRSYLDTDGHTRSAVLKWCEYI